MGADHERLYTDHAPTGNAQDLLRLACDLESNGDLRAAATAYDQAHLLAPSDAEVTDARRSLLDQMAIKEHGIIFRYVPAGTFLMGSDTGEPDERPVHPVRLGDYWLAETPVSWATYCDLMGWEPPPAGHPEQIPEKGHGRVPPGFILHEANKIRLQYCEDETTRALDWHAHTSPHEWTGGDGEKVGSRTMFGEPERDDPRRPWGYGRKPMVSVAWQEAEELCERLSTSDIGYSLPTEAEWERAARGGLAGCRYPWGDVPPNAELCDFDRFNDFSILPTHRLPPNGYGLYAMAGSVWEWTSDWYDADYYRTSPGSNPTGPSTGTERVLRGGSWADCADAVTASFRMSRPAVTWRDGEWGGHMTPNIGFRLCRKRRPGDPTG
ncbi:formylglycine-generating enzyme family protein [Actinomadura sp. HBU206391]|uniref:formylglycine-generating enzyme family protein n=1 Tax=Actinomadura sp. HBU206391 TaxID=2731692 RepID=UPI00164F20BE|nr:SUMF1/EgtB/PvdO family nonheme iron enzyme [Actinomadura sp. HBU206391]MBC6460200.1 SUMF1/EgtB/PvdO family nonheme iron enzyme [Actinomadura sp. HBU206391]